MSDVFTYDREVFFDAVRATLFGGSLTQQQVDGQTVLLAVWEYQYPTGDIRWISYILATVFKECATRMWPITEYGTDSYLQSKPYWPFIGRGFVMLTWEDNYAKASTALGLVDDRDLVSHPDLALDSLIASRVIYRGMDEGWFTGKRLDQYFNATTDDPVNARQIVNGNDCDEEIAGYHAQFLAALEEAQMVQVAPAPTQATVHLNIQTTPGVVVSAALNGELIMGQDSAAA